MLDLSPSCVSLVDRKENSKGKRTPTSVAVIHQEEAGQLISGWSLVLTLDDGRRMCSRRSRPGPPAHQRGQSDGTWSGIGKGVAVVRDVAKYGLLRYLLMNHVLGLVWACCGPLTTQAHGGAVRAWLSNKVVVAIAITRSNCQGHARPVNKGSIQREAGYTMRHASILCASMSPSGGWRDWEAHRHKESRECQFRRQARELRKEESQA